MEDKDIMITAMLTDVLVRISVLEKILIDKQILSSEELSKLGSEFADMINSKIKEASEGGAKEKVE